MEGKFKPTLILVGFCFSLIPDFSSVEWMSPYKSAGRDTALLRQVTGLKEMRRLVYEESVWLAC